MKWVRQNIELFFWLISLTLLFFLPADQSSTSLCLFSLLGFGHCPGCGLGHSIHYALRMNMAASINHHPMGIFAVLIIFNRIKQLIHLLIKKHEA
ncbi:MAG: hypothetical protein RLZZ28_1967 [Bacteroidota bacterium]|jgi:hypothetical protein